MVQENMLFNVKVSYLSDSATVNMGSSIHYHPGVSRVWIAFSYPSGDAVLHVDAKKNLYIDKELIDQSS